MKIAREEAIERAAALLCDNHPVPNRGRAAQILYRAGLDRQHEDILSAAVRLYEQRKDCRLTEALSDTEKKRLRAKARRMTAQQVKDHIAQIDKADYLFWACWRQYKDKRRWRAELTVSDFSIHFV